MSEKAQNNEELQKLLGRFIALANEMKDEGNSVELVNASLLLASCTYATYISAGNEGYLKKSGIDKITAVYRRNLAGLQDIKKAQVNPDNKP